MRCRRAPVPVRSDTEVTSATPRIRKIRAPSTQHGTGGIERGSLAAANAVVDSGFQLLLGLVPRDQCGARRKDRRERQEQATHNWTPMLTHEASAGRDRSAQCEAHRELPPVRIPETREID